MLIPIDETVDIFVKVIVPTKSGLDLHDGVLRRRDSERLFVFLDKACDLDVGDPVIVDEGSARYRCRVQLLEGQNLSLDLQREHHADARSSGRLYASLEVKYRPVFPNDRPLVLQWLAEGRAMSGPWYSSDPGVDLSMSGMRFVGTQSCELDQVLLTEVLLPEGDVGWRCTSLVRRIRARPGGRQEIAVELVDILEDDEDEMAAFFLNLE